MPCHGGKDLSTLARVRQIIRAVPRGRVITYGEVAEAAGHPRAARLTVWALQEGEDLPWHRVVASGGRIALRGAEGREQRLRLEVEGVAFRGGRVRMDLHGWTPRKRWAPRSVPRPPRSTIERDGVRPDFETLWEGPPPRREGRRRALPREDAVREWR